MTPTAALAWLSSLLAPDPGWGSASSHDACAALLTARQYLAEHYPRRAWSGRPFVLGDTSTWQVFFPSGRQLVPSGPVLAVTVRVDRQTGAVVAVDGEAWYILPPVSVACVGPPLQ